MKRITYLAVALPVLLVAPAPPGQGHPLRGVVIAPPPPASRSLAMGLCEGTLTEVTPTTLTLANSVDESPPHGPAPGQFVIGPELASGDDYNPQRWIYHPTIQVKMYRFSYRLRDIRIGDKLQIYYARVNGMDVCYQICIHRRPGGRVPPIPAEPRRYSNYEYHNVASWRGECEAKGLPWPYPPPPELPPGERDPNAKPSPQ